MGKRKVDFVSRVRASPEADIMLNFLIYRFRRGYSTLILVSGPRGSGKSSTCFRLSEIYNDNLNPIREKMNLKKRETGMLCRSHLDFVKFVKDAQLGDDCILEEISVLYPSRRSMGEENTSIGMILDIIRKKRLVIFANTPIALSADKTIRTTADAQITTYKIINSENVVLSRFYKLQTNYHTGEVFKHKFRREGKKVHFMYTKMPNMDRWKWYESKKDDFIDETYEKLVRKAAMKRDKELEKLGMLDKPKNRKPLTATQEETLKVLARVQGPNKYELAGKELGVSSVAVGKNKRAAMKKGYTVEEFQ